MVGTKRSDRRVWHSKNLKDETQTLSWCKTVLLQWHSQDLFMFIPRNKSVIFKVALRGTFHQHKDFSLHNRTSPPLLPTHR